MNKINKKSLFRIAGLLSVLAIILIFSSYRGTDKNNALQQVMMEALTMGHYSPQVMNNDFSEKVFNLYIKRLDYNKKFLLQSDIDELKRYYDKLDDELGNNSFDFYTIANQKLDTRIQEAKVFYKDLLKNPFDFTKDENIESNPDKLTFAKNTEALKEEWRKYLKYQTLARLADAIEIQNKAKENKDTSVKIKSVETLEAEARNRVDKTMGDWFTRLEKLSPNERFSNYMNAIANTYDPHTEYFAPREKQDFDIQLSGQLEGIGAQLQQKDGNIKVTHIVPGSASAKQGELKAGDVIMKVAQGAQEPVDITGMELDDAVQLIRGKKGTEVRLTVKKPDGTILIIPIIRDVVVLEATYAQSYILEENGKRFGYIKLPSFYADFNRTGGRSCSEDIYKELSKLNSEKIDGIVLDLRNNGGGSLGDVVRMVGFFIDKGPVVQVKGRTSSPKVLNDNAGGAIYSGPLVVMINSLSASASEIFAAAIQDYKRGVVVGSNSYGKGTVQNIYDLDQFIPANYGEYKPLGSLKLTIEKFYRINGDATQLKGVIPDVELPDPYSYLDIYEKDQDYPLPFDRIPATTYKPFKLTNLSDIKKRSESRVSKSAAFNEVIAETERLKQQKAKSQISLNLEQYIAFQKKSREESKRLDDAAKAETPLEISTLKSDQNWLNADTSRLSRINANIKDLKKDIYLHEASRVITDIK